MAASMALLKSGADPNIADNEGFSPFLATIYAHYNFENSARFNIVETMIRHGARVTDCTKQGWNAIYLASGLADTNILELLLSLQLGLDVNSRDYLERTPLVLTCR